MALRLLSPDAISPVTSAGGDNVLPVPYCSQQPFLNLCWAACCEMVLQYYGANALRLCDLPSRAFSCNCCTSPAPPQCDQTYWPEDVYAQSFLSSLPVPAALVPFDCQRFEQPFTVDAVQHEIDGQRPIHAMFQWTSGGSHLVVVSGYHSNGDLQVQDPLYSSVGRASYEYVLQAYGAGNWIVTYYNLRPINGAPVQTP